MGAPCFSTVMEFWFQAAQISSCKLQLFCDKALLGEGKGQACCINTYEIFSSSLGVLESWKFTELLKKNKQNFSLFFVLMETKSLWPQCLCAHLSVNLNTFHIHVAGFDKKHRDLKAIRVLQSFIQKGNAQRAKTLKIFLYVCLSGMCQEKAEA